jgi:hypothetical protein
MECRRDAADNPKKCSRINEMFRAAWRLNCVMAQEGINLAELGDVRKGRQPKVRRVAVLISITAMKLIPAAETIALRIIPSSRYLSQECKILV